MKLEANTPLKPVVQGPIQKEQLKEYANAALDFNPIHLDETFAKEAGFPSVIVHGMLSMAFFGDLLLMNFPESQYELKRFRTRFRKVTFPGDTLTCEGKIKAVTPEGRIQVVFSAKNQKNEVTSDGDAEICPLS